MDMLSYLHHIMRWWSYSSIEYAACSKWNQRDAVQQVFYCTL